MLCCTVLCCAVLCCAVLCCALLLFIIYSTQLFWFGRQVLLLLLGLVRVLAGPAQHSEQPPRVPPALLFGYGRLLRRHTRSRRGWHQEVRKGDRVFFARVLLIRRG